MPPKTEVKYKLTGAAIGLFFFGVIPTIILSVFAWFAYPSWLWMFLLAFASIWLAGCMYGFVRELRVDPRKAEEASNIEKLRPVVKSGAQLVYESNVILDKDDRKALDRAFTRPLPALLFILFLVIIISLFTNYWVLLIALLPAGLIIASWRSISIMKKRNRKVILRGIITGRPYYYNKDRKDATHFLVIGDQKVKVEASLYEQYIAGEIIELHYVGWLSGSEMKIDGAVFTRHRKLTPDEYQNWLSGFTS